MADWLTDLRYGFRVLARRPGRSILAVAALALGIGLTTTMFSIVNGAILRGLPFEESERIIHLANVRPAQSDDDFEVSLHDYLDWRARQQSFQQLSAFHNQTVNLSAGGALPVRHRGAVMTTNTLALLRQRPVTGRDFEPADGRPGAPLVALIRHDVWMTQFKGDPDLFDKTIRVNGEIARIVGIMPERFGFPGAHAIWVPLREELPVRRGEGTTLEVIGRLRDGITPDAALAEFAGIASQLEAEHPENKGVTVQMKSYIQEFLGPEIIMTLSTMLAAVMGVFLIAVANVTNLQMADAAERVKEVAVRSALGASRWRVVRQLVLESGIVATLGALGGIGLGWVGVTIFNRNIAETNPPFWIDIRIDGMVLLFVLAIAVAAALLAGLIPGLRVLKEDVNAVLKDESRGSTGLRAGLFSRILVMGELTVSFCLLIVSGLMIKSVVALGALEYPFATEDVFMARLSPDPASHAGAPELGLFASRLEERLAAVPGVRHVALSTAGVGTGGLYYLALEGQTYASLEEQPTVMRAAVSPQYFDVLRVRPSAGRVFDARDREGTLPVTVVSEDFAAKYYPEGALGRRIRLGRDPNGPWWTIVGVVPSLVFNPQPDQVQEAAYVPYVQAPDRALTIYAATSVEPTSITSGVRAAVQDLDPDLPIFDANSLAMSFWQRAWPFRVFGGLFMAFGLAALVLGAAGLYGVMALAVRRRTPEIGVRMALGADRPRILRLIAGQGMRQVAIGLVLGVALGRVLAGFLTILLFQVQPWDPLVFVTAALVLGLTGLAASVIPAMRAAAVDPVVALRHE